MSWRTLILTKPGNCSGERSDRRNKTKITEIEKEMQRVDLLPGAHRRDNQLAGATLLAVALVMLVEQREGAIGGRCRRRAVPRQTLLKPAKLALSPPPPPRAPFHLPCGKPENIWGDL